MNKPKRDTDSKQSIQTLFLQPAESYELRWRQSQPTIRPRLMPPLNGELIDFAGTHLTWLQEAIPGYRRAYLFPGQG